MRPKKRFYLVALLLSYAIIAKDYHDLNKNKKDNFQQEIKIVFQNYCKYFGDEKKPIAEETFQHLVVDIKHRLLYCSVPKVASTSWRRLFFRLSGEMTSDDKVKNMSRTQIHLGLSKLSDEKYDGLRGEILANFNKILFVRDPLERIVSAFKDKIERRDPESLYDFQKEIGLKIEQMYRNSTSGGRTVTFTEFVKFITDKLTYPHEQRNEHWRSIYDLCNPCAVRYNFIGYFERLTKDMERVMKALSLQKFNHLFLKDNRPSHAAKYTGDYWRKVDDELKKKFFSSYQRDYILFGYDYQP